MAEITLNYIINKLVTVQLIKSDSYESPFDKSSLLLPSIPKQNFYLLSCLM